MGGASRGNRSDVGGEVGDVDDICSLGDDKTAGSTAGEEDGIERGSRSAEAINDMDVDAAKGSVAECNSNQGALWSAVNVSEVGARGAEGEGVADKEDTSSLNKTLADALFLEGVEAMGEGGAGADEAVRVWEKAAKSGSR